MSHAWLVWIPVMDSRISEYHRKARRLQRDAPPEEDLLEQEEDEARRLISGELEKQRIRRKLEALEDLAGLLEGLPPGQVDEFDDAVKRRSFFG